MKHTYLGFTPRFFRQHTSYRNGLPFAEFGADHFRLVNLSSHFPFIGETPVFYDNDVEILPGANTRQLRASIMDMAAYEITPIDLLDNIAVDMYGLVKEQIVPYFNDEDYAPQSIVLSDILIGMVDMPQTSSDQAVPFTIGQDQHLSKVVYSVKYPILLVWGNVASRNDDFNIPPLGNLPLQWRILKSLN